ncbi:mannose-6-phosphate isomerase-like protein (cupin superfamily) [Comamonas sp. BIGb0152]|uniref:cupin domain-containing protein n=1 Tax=Comamonas sp. BIGb0152 TaxID=2940601 RepID=UPI002167BF21|nr:cupin domain-containing protein [Comamonas sp. BIGb0152]MCS4294324.1 mannose-6-phosphate isomerase-like protein (cupin superfamily) [Comamonas sp. BIGb0152]
MPAPIQTSPTPTHRGQSQSIDLRDKIALLQGHWQPRVVAEMNDYQFKVVKIAGEFVWHQHSDTDETFIVLDGELRIDLRDASGGTRSINLQAGQMAVIPQGVEHKPFAQEEVQLLLIEPRGVANTGDGEAGARTVANDLWI